jgi:hypothetical protein
MAEFRTNLSQPLLQSPSNIPKIMDLKELFDLEFAQQELKENLKEK